jgi:ribonuclease MRP protein subunit RMP1
VADNQYAPLGLMLLGTLARLGKVIGLEKIGEGEEAGDIGMNEDDRAMVDVDAVAVEGDLLHADLGGKGQEMEDIGVAVKREEMEVEGETRKTEEVGSGSVQKHAREIEVEEMVPMVETGTPTPAPKRKKKKKHDAIDELFEGLI